MHAPKLYIEQSGDENAPVIIFLHAIATSGWMWREVAGQLKDFHCIIVDLPGHGKSAQVKWETLSDTANQLNAVIESYSRHPQVHLVGLSFGSYVGMQYLSMYPESVKSAVFSGLNVMPFPNKWLMNAMGLLILPFVKTEVFIRKNAETLKIPAKHYGSYKESVQQLHKASFVSAGKELASFRLPENIAEITCRTLFVTGEAEHTLILQSLRQLKREMPNSVACIVPKGGHGWIGENPRLFADTVRSWISNQPLPDELKTAE